MLTDVTPALQRALNLSVTRGALVQDFTSEAPAERSGLRVYDIIVDVDGRDIASNDDLIRDISVRKPGTVVRLEVVRDDQRLTVPVRLAERPTPSRDESDTLPGGGPAPNGPAPPEVPLGLTVRDVDRSAAVRLGIPGSVQGVLISRVDPTGAAFSPYPVRRGLIITEINRKPIRSASDYQRTLAAAKPGDVLALYYFDPTKGERALVTVTMER
jgi:serine protease Do